jgi:hypothetical protein
VRVDNPAPERLAACFAALDKRLAAAGRPVFVKYLNLGTHVVRLVNHSRAFTPHVEKQLTYALVDHAPRYDATLVIWREENFDGLAPALGPACVPAPANPLLARVRRLAAGRDSTRAPAPDTRLQVFDAAYSRWHPLVNVDPQAKIASAHNPETNTWYYGVEDLSPEEFIRQGHIFVQIFNRLLKSPSTGLAHAAAVALNGRGALLCARGQRGKSTLAVRALLDGFDYVSDDYLVLGRERDGLYAWPIYSVITLSPMMYGDLYGALDAKFVSNNARKDKYVFNIARYHDRFAGRCPISLGMIPQIVSDPEPSVVACSRMGRGRAVTQLVHSTIAQMGDGHDTATVKKLLDFVRDLPFYQINLCRDTDKNVLRLRKFLTDGECGRQENTRGMLGSRAVSQGIFGQTR